MSEDKLDVYNNMLFDLMQEITAGQRLLNDDSEEYKNLQYINELLDICYGASEPHADAESRQKDLDTVKIMINRMEIM